MRCDCITEPSTVTRGGVEVCCVCGYPQRPNKTDDEPCTCTIACIPQGIVEG